jgi:hypothetical protein
MFCNGVLLRRHVKVSRSDAVTVGRCFNAGSGDDNHWFASRRDALTWVVPVVWLGVQFDHGGGMQDCIYAAV